MRERGPGPVSNRAADEEARHHADIRQLKQATEELGGMGSREFIIYQASGSALLSG